MYIKPKIMAATPEGYGASVQSILNKEDGSLPFGLYEPSQEGKVTWNCGYDEQNRITSVFCCDFGDHKDKKIAHVTMDDAINCRDTLVRSGWLPMKTPELTVSYADGGERNLTRKEKRYLSRKVAKMSKKNPFEGNDD